MGGLIDLTQYFHDDHDALTRLETGSVRAQHPLVTRLLDPLEFIHAVAFTAAPKKPAVVVDHTERLQPATKS